MLERARGARGQELEPAAPTEGAGAAEMDRTRCAAGRECAPEQLNLSTPKQPCLEMRNRNGQSHRRDAQNPQPGGSITPSNNCQNKQEEK